MFIHQMPPYHQRDLAITRRVTFDRSHFIVGTFTWALKTLEQYSPDDFHSEHLNNYVIGVLRKNSLFYEEVMGEGHQDHYERVLCLSQKYNFHFWLRGACPSPVILCFCDFLLLLFLLFLAKIFILILPSQHNIQSHFNCFLAIQI